jgi:hypothetical protein
MPTLSISTDLPVSRWPEIDKALAEGTLIDLTGSSAPALKVGRVPNGTASGKSTVMLQVPLPDGKLVIVETTLALFINAARSLAISDGIVI